MDAVLPLLKGWLRYSGLVSVLHPPGVALFLRFKFDSLGWKDRVETNVYSLHRLKAFAASVGLLGARWGACWLLGIDMIGVFGPVSGFASLVSLYTIYGEVEGNIMGHYFMNSATAF